MEQYYANDSFTALKTETGVYIEERKKGSLKMILVISGIAILMMVGAFVIGFLGGDIGRMLAPVFFWCGAVVLVIGLVAFIVKFALQGDPKITIDTTKNEIGVRGKTYAFDEITEIVTQKQEIMGRTMIVAFLIVAGKKKSLFSTAIVVPSPIELEEFIGDLNEVVQNHKSKKDIEE